MGVLLTRQSEINAKELIAVRKIHVITQKEAVAEEKLKGCTAAVIDVFLATSTIAFLLENNYEPIYAVKDSEQAIELSKRHSEPHILLGETKGESIHGFQYPDPCLIRPSDEKRAAIICSTNGTIAIEKASKANMLFISSLINGHLIAERIHLQEDDSSIVLVCSGNDDRFSMEDFIGAGQIVDHLMKKGDYDLSDSSKLARNAYRNARTASFKELYDCETANLLKRFNFTGSVDFILRHHEKVDIVPLFMEGKIVNDHQKVATKRV